MVRKTNICFKAGFMHSGFQPHKPIAVKQTLCWLHARTSYVLVVLPSLSFILVLP